MAFHLSFHLPPLSSHSHSRTSTRSNNRPRRPVYASQPLSGKSKERRKNAVFGLLLLLSRCHTSLGRSRSRSTLSMAATSASFAAQSTCGTRFDEMEFNRTDRLVWTIHEAARSFSLAVESLKLSGSGPELAMAWIGKDVHGWHKRISYMVAVYVLLKTAIEVEILLSHERHFNNAFQVKEILTPKVILVGDYIETQLNARHSGLGEWFRVVELPSIAEFFIPLLKKWSMEYAGSGVAGMIVAISCCVAVGRLSAGKIACSLCNISIDDVMEEIMDLAHSLVSVEKLHQLSIEAGFELDLLSHYGRKVFPSKKSDELEFWIGLAQKKLAIAFEEETMISGGKNFPDKDQANTLATLGLFAYLGRRTRLFISRMGIEDLDESIRDLLSYLECGSIFIYPEFSYISVYQSFMEVVTDEIGWLDFYASFPTVCNQERRRSKQHALQAEKEIVLSTVVTICYDVFSGFAHFNRSTQQLLDSNLLKFLLQSQNLLASCLEDHRAVYGKSSEVFKITETSAQGSNNEVILSEAQQNFSNVITNGDTRETSQVIMGASAPETGAVNSAEEFSTSNPKQQSLLKKYTVKLVTASSDAWMGTQLLCVDVMMALELLFKQLHGYQVTRRERIKLQRTLNDVGSLIPVTILMLLPVSAVGHAAMLAAINKYMPSMIPSPYSSVRLNVVKQLDRTKKMEVRLRGNYDDPSSKI